ncbi:putative photosynthetic complex assembly protein [Ectothiorhodospira magna]|uniref:Putative photosynthetic complex assembly protein n=1 Tax=Ectothiorhodospira magna TaxID=867345 RepID=A0A1H9BX71_9GAMM|nr:photosynthetic complex assembly protein PuhC [Ectothiorhodospira magna]SEP93586.1 putative photosynthetic complex assembly protein [Ectothiorhodospira magna]
MTQQPSSQRSITPWVLAGVGVLAVMLAAGVYYLGASATATRSAPTQGDASPADATPVTAVHTLNLRTEDRPGGYLAVLDASNDRVLQVLAPSEGGFMRTVVRIIALDRRTEAEKRDPAPLLLTRWSNGHLTLEDPATGLRYELNAFGSTNAAAFGQLLDAARDS